MFGSRRRNIEQVIEANLDALTRFAYFRTGDRTEAEDIVYEAVLRLLENREKVVDARCYLFRIVYNLCQDEFRRKRLPTVPFDNIDLPDKSDERLDQEEIDRINILRASFHAMNLAVNQLNIKPQMLLIDGNRFINETDIPHLCIIKGDAKSASIAAASIIAKVTRDRMMEEYDAMWPEYGFAKHKGYGTAAHIAALKALGPCRSRASTTLAMGGSAFSLG